MTFRTKRSPSQAKRFLSCPGTFAVCDTIPETLRDQAGVAAQIGTAAHALAERCLREGSEPETYRGWIVELLDDDQTVQFHRPTAKLPGPGKVFFAVDSDMIGGVETLTNYVRSRLAELGLDKSVLQLETRTNPLPERDDTSGTADVTIDAWPTLLEVVDYKNGWQVVEHKNNQQIMAYLLGKAIETEFSHEAYKVTVVQPNAQHEDGRIRSFDATKKSLREFQARYRKGISLCEDAENARNAPKPGEPIDPTWAERWLMAGDHCMWCAGQAICPARRAEIQRLAKIDFADEPTEIQFSENLDELAEVLRWLPMLDSFSRAVATAAQRAMEKGFKIPGFKLVYGRSTRKWREDMDEKALVAAITKSGFLTKDKLFTKPELVSGPAAEKLVAKEKRKEFAERFLVKPQGKLTVTTEDDPREEVVCSAGTDFEGVES